MKVYNTRERTMFYLDKRCTLFVTTRSVNVVV